MPRGAIQPRKPRSPRPSPPPTVDSQATSGRTASTSSAVSSSAGRTTWCSEAGVTVAEIAMNSTPMTSETSVSKKGRRTTGSRPGRVAMATPMMMAEISPASSRTRSHPAATPTVRASWVVVPSSSPSRSRVSSSQSTAAPSTPPRTPAPALARMCSTASPGPTRRPDSSAVNTSAPSTPPTASISEPSQSRIRRSPAPGRTKFSSGPTTVGPETIRITPSITAALAEMCSSGAATSAATGQVTRVPIQISRATVRRAAPVSRRRSSSRPAS